MSYTKPTTDFIYFNARINGSTDGSLSLAQYNETRSIAIIDNPSEYYFSCIRFNVPTSTIPLLIVSVQPFPNTDSTKTVYSVSLAYNGFQSAQTFIIWAPVNASYSVPKKGLTQHSPYTDANDNYYYCHSYVYFMNLVNKAYQTAFNDLAGQTTLPVGSVAPYYWFDSKSKIFTLVAQEAFYDVNNLSTPIQIFMNNDLWNLFGAMSSINHSSPAQVGNDRQILISSDIANLDASGNIQFEQEYVSICQWMAIKINYYYYKQFTNYNGSYTKR